MRKRRRTSGNNKFFHEALVIGVCVVVTGVLLSSFDFDIGEIQNVAEKAAIASTMTALPDKSTIFIKDRFADELVGQQEINTDPIEQQPNKEATKQKPEKKEDETKKDTEKIDNKKKTPPTIPLEYRGELTEQFFGVSQAAKNMYVQYKNGFIKNSTKIFNDQVQEILKEEWDRESLEWEQPMVLIYHTHATESFEDYDNGCYDKRNTWRSTDNSNNITVVGDIITKILEDNGIGVVHDKTQHDYPSYNGSYERSAVTIKKYLEQYPTIQIALDIHRDAIQHDDVLVKPICEINGEKASQVMLIAGCDDGTMNMPNWRENLRFGAELQNVMEQEYPGLARPLFFAYRKYNQDLCPAGLLLEVGSHGNTLEEASISGKYVGRALVKLITGKDAEVTE